MGTKAFPLPHMRGEAKTDGGATRGPSGMLDKIVGVDLLEMPTGNQCRITINVVCSGTAFQQAAFSTSKESAEVTEKFDQLWVRHYAPPLPSPEVIVCDQGGAFTGHDWVWVTSRTTGSWCATSTHAPHGSKDAPRGPGDSSSQFAKAWGELGGPQCGRSQALAQRGG